MEDPFPDANPPHLGPREGQGHPDPGPGVFRPRDHLHHPPRVQDQALEGRAGDGGGLEDPGEDHPPGEGEDPFHAVRFKPQARQALLQHLGAFQLGQVGLEPGEGHPHKTPLNCSKNFSRPPKK